MSKVHTKVEDKNILDIVSKEGNGDGEIDLNGDAYKYLSTDVSRTGWKMISFILSNLQKNYNRIAWVTR